jgi:outer membrane protein OmpA-like peptidoglycan-associated protein
MTSRIKSLLGIAIRISTAAIFAGTLAACTTPTPPPQLESARQAYESAAAEPDIERYASVPLYEAKQDLDRANKAWANSKDAVQTAHMASLAEKRVEIARTVAAGEKARAEVEELVGSGDKVMLEARERELAELKAKRTEGGMVLTMGGDVLFKTGSSTLTAGAKAELGRVADFLNGNPDREVVVSGHTDNTGGAELNQTLSEKRADSVGAYLSSQGVAASRIATRGFGPSLPAAPNDNVAGRQQNRRVDIVILDVGEKASEHVLAKP